MPQTCPDFKGNLIFCTISQQTLNCSKSTTETLRRCEIYSKLLIKTLDQLQCCSDFNVAVLVCCFFVNFDHISHFFTLFLTIVEFEQVNMLKCGPCFHTKICKGKTNTETKECPKQCKFQTLHSNIALSESIVCLSFRHRTKGRLHWGYFNVLRLVLRLTSAYNFIKKETLVHVFYCEFCVIAIVIVVFLLLTLSK